MADKVLVYQIGSLGDTIVSIPAYRAVRRHFSGKSITLLEARMTDGRVMPSDMLLREGLIDGVTNYPHNTATNPLLSKFQLWRSVARERPKTVVYIGPGERTPKDVARDKSFFRLCGAKDLIGFHAYDLSKIQTRDKEGNLPPSLHQTQIRLDRLEKDGVSSGPGDWLTPLLSASNEECEAVDAWLSENRKHSGLQLVGVGLISAKAATRWPMEHFEDLGRRLIATGKVELILTGGPMDKDVSEAMVASWGDGLNASGQFGVNAMGHLLSRCHHFIGLDTGTTHLAAAFGTRVIAITADHMQPNEWSPLGDGHIVLTHRVGCGGCRVPVCPVPGHPCMVGLTVEEVFNASMRLLDQSP